MKLISYALASYRMFRIEFACSAEAADPAPELQLSILELCLRSLLSAAGDISLQLYFDTLDSSSSIY
jgi:hypothetical protein